MSGFSSASLSGRIAYRSSNVRTQVGASALGDAMSGQCHDLMGVSHQLTLTGAQTAYGSHRGWAHQPHGLVVTHRASCRLQFGTAQTGPLHDHR
jgi:hypothetical protein